MPDQQSPATPAAEQMDGASLDIAAINRAQLKALFPAAFTETRNDKGELVESVDFERLKAELGTFTDLFESRRERYGMDWPGKKDALKLIQTPTYATLKPARDESINFDTTENLFIEGDNLEVLKLLQKSYYGKVKMIYIDPPYNTGNEFIYPDNFAESLDTYLEYAGLSDGTGKIFSTNTTGEGRFHTKWMNMMYPRLYVARNLLVDDGMIFVSIDDGEVANVRKILDDIFGEENFVDSIIWKKRYGGGAKEKYLVSIHEYVLVYAKNLSLISELSIPLSESSVERYYTQKDANFEERGPYRTHPLEAMKSFEERPNLAFSVKAPDGTEIHPKRQWRWSRERMDDALKKGEVEFVKGRSGEWTVYSKQYLKDDSGEIRSAKAFSILDGIYTQHGTNEMVEIFGDAQVFPFPKPSKLIEKLIEIAGVRDGIILDFFAGSGSTGHAVMSANAQDNGTRKFILVQLPEKCSEDSAAAKLGYSTITDICRDRLRKVLKRSANGDLVGDTAAKGFRSFSLDRSSFKKWKSLGANVSLADLSEQIELHIDHINVVPDDDLLFELLIKSGFTPTERVTVQKLAGIDVYSVADGGLLICLADKITRDLIDAVAAAEPLQFVCLDSAFAGNDQLKANAVQTFAARNQGRDKTSQIVFRTV